MTEFFGGISHVEKDYPPMLSCKHGTARQSREISQKLVQQFKTVPPYTHSLLRLCKDLSLDLPENILDILATVDKYYLAARYPAYKENLNLNDRFSAETLFRKAQEAFEWLQSRLKLQRK